MGRRETQKERKEDIGWEKNRQEKEKEKERKGKKKGKKERRKRKKERKERRRERGWSAMAGGRRRRPELAGEGGESSKPRQIVGCKCS